MPVGTTCGYRWVSAEMARQSVISFYVSGAVLVFSNMFNMDGPTLGCFYELRAVHERTGYLGRRRWFPLSREDGVASGRNAVAVAVYCTLKTCPNLVRQSPSARGLA